MWHHLNKMKGSKNKQKEKEKKIHENEKNNNICLQFTNL